MSAAAKPLVLVVPGQTASGKSRLCLELAARLDGEIVSMDALKVYRGMDIGTAKTPLSQRRGIPHHLLDLVEPTESFNMGLYLARLEPTLRDIHSRGRLPIIDCGTPMYLQGFLSGVLDAPEPDLELRSNLEARPSEDLFDELRSKDPASAARLHPNDRKRVIRALEFAIQTGTPISERQTQFAGRRDDLQIVMTGPLWPEEALKERISRRVDTMIAEGFVEEVRGLRERGFSKTAGDAIGYRQLNAHVDGVLTLNEAVEDTKRKTWQLARRQHMWFKRHADLKWIRASSDDELTRAAVFVAHELVGVLRASLTAPNGELRQEPRSQEVTSRVERFSGDD